MTKKLRSIRIEGEVAYVTLTKGYEAIIDAVDAARVGRHNWFVHIQPHTVYARTMVRDGSRQKTVYLHRFICGEKSGLEIDHIDYEGLNNRRENLRLATRAENARNRKPKPYSPFRSKGVAFEKDRGLWRVRIRICGKNKHVGRFESHQLAAQAYLDAAIKYYGPPCFLITRTDMGEYRVPLQFIPVEEIWTTST